MRSQVRAVVVQRDHQASPPNRQPESKFSLKKLNDYARFLAGEFLGTLILTWAHAGLALSIANTATLESQDGGDVPNSATDVATVAIGSGLVLVGLVYALGHISGAHLNPSVTMAFVARGDFTPLGFFPYVAAQVAGGIVGGLILYAVFNNGPQYGSLGANSPANGFNAHSAFWMEFMASVFLHLAIVGTATRGKNIGGHAALAAGLSIGGLIGFLTPYGGGSMNPARSIGPAIFANNPTVRDNLWIYVAAPLSAAILTGLVLRWLAPSKSEQDDSDAAQEGGESAGAPAPKEDRATKVV